MSTVYVAEALQDERGKARGGIPGDQGDGKKAEIVVRANVKRNYAWDAVLRCRSRATAEIAAEYARRIAACPAFGYNRDARWEGPKAIEKVGADRLEEAECGDFDCSSLCIEVYRLAGVPLKMTGYTGSMVKLFMATGDFDEFSDAKHLDTMDYAMVGDVYVAKNKHALIVLTDGDKVEPEPEPYPQGPFVEIIKGAVNVRKQPAGRIILTAHEGDTFPYLGYTEEDASGKAWWAVDVVSEHMVGFISSANTRHAVLVNEGL